jgi:hypothetical protein
LTWHGLLEKSEVLAPYQLPELDIVAYLPKVDSLSELDRASHALFLRAADADRKEQIHLATYVVKPQALKDRGFSLTEDADQARIMRSVLMKPEQENWIGDLHSHLEAITREMIG